MHELDSTNLHLNPWFVSTSNPLGTPFCTPFVGKGAPPCSQQDILSIEFKQCLNFSLRLFFTTIVELGFTTLLVSFATNLPFLHPWLSFIYDIITKGSSLPFTPLGIPPLIVVSPINLYKFLKVFSPFNTTKAPRYLWQCIAKN